MRQLICGQGIGLVVGAVFDIQSAAFMAPTFAIPFLLFAGFFISLSSIPSYMKWMSYVSFFRYGFEGSMLAIYDYDRAPLDCFESYCHFRFPRFPSFWKNSTWLTVPIFSALLACWCTLL